MEVNTMHNETSVFSVTTSQSYIKVFSIIFVISAFVILALLTSSVSLAAATLDTVASADGVPIRYEVRGEGQLALVFVHCWCCDRSYWNEQVDLFAQKYTVVTLDLAGHGESGLDREKWTMEAFGEDVASVVRKLDLDQVVLIGHSMGGPVIVEAARRIPERVIGLIAVDTLHDVEVKYTQEQIEGFLAPWREDFVAATDSYIRQYMFTPKTDPTLIDKIATDMSAAPPEVGIGAMSELVQYDAAVAIQEVQAPIRCINSDNLPTNVEAGQRHATSFEVVLMSEVGHFLMMEDPRTFNQLLDEVVKGLIRVTTSKEAQN
jgi:pimeloyl-ACP methyl ester carboxylesterase